MSDNVSNKQYLGDGVYAELDPARMIKLTTEVGLAEATNTIYLEPAVFAALLHFARDIGWHAYDEDRAAAEYRCKECGGKMRVIDAKKLERECARCGIREIV